MPVFPLFFLTLLFLDLAFSPVHSISTVMYSGLFDLLRRETPLIKASVSLNLFLYIAYNPFYRIGTLSTRRRIEQ